MNLKLKFCIAAALIYLMGAFSAFAQSTPNWSYGYVPTPAEWNLWFSKKMDYNGVSPCLTTGCTFSGLIQTNPSSSNSAGLNISPGSAPSAPNNGDLWVTASGIFVQINGVTVQLSGGGATIGVGGTNQLAYYTAPSTINGLATANNGVLVTNGSGAPSISSTLPSGIAATNMSLTNPTMTTPTLGVAAGTSLALGGATIGGNALAVTGTTALGGAITVTSNSASALAVGPNGATNPTLQVNGSVTSEATGVSITGAAAGGGAAIAAISSGANEALSINAKGSGGINIGNVSTGTVTVTPPVTLTSASANSLIVGPNGTTNPTLQVDDSTASAATGFNIKSAAAGAGIALSAISSATNENLTLNAKGSGTISIGGTSTGTVTIGAGGGGLTVSNSFTATGLVTYADMATAAIATNSQYFSGAANTLVPTSVIYSAETTTTFGATTTFDFSTFINTAVTLTGNITTQTLSNVKAGQAGQIRFIQDATGSRTTAWNSIFKFQGGVTPTLSTAANAVDALEYYCTSSSYCIASLLQNVH